MMTLSWQGQVSRRSPDAESERALIPDKSARSGRCCNFGMTNHPPGGATPARRHIWVDLLVYPAHTLPIAAAPVMVGAALAARHHVFAPMAVVLAYLGSWLIHLAGLLTDTHELLRRYPRAVEHPDLTNALQNGTLTLGQIKVAIAACLMLMLPIAVQLLLVGAAPALAIGVVGMIASFGYSVGPRPYTKLGIAEPIFFAMFGIVAVAGTYYAQIAWLAAAASQPVPSLAALPLDAYLVGLPVGALVTNILLIDDLEDRHFDASKEWLTLAVRFGPTGSRVAYCFFSLLAYLAPVALYALGGYGACVLLPLVTLPLALRILPVVLTHEDEPTLEPMTARAAMLAFAYAALLAMGISLQVMRVFTAAEGQTPIVSSTICAWPMPSCSIGWTSVSVARAPTSAVAANPNALIERKERDGCGAMLACKSTRPGVRQ